MLQGFIKSIHKSSHTTERLRRASPLAFCSGTSTNLLPVDLARTIRIIKRRYDDNGLLSFLQ
jgi:hypothetical protein